MRAEPTCTIPPRRRQRFKVVARGLVASVLTLVSLGILGCKPRLDPQEYGEVVTELPHVPGVEKPYPLPSPDESSDEAEDGQPTPNK